MKTVLITGVNRGIGEALAKKFQEKGYFVIGTYYKTKTSNGGNRNIVELELDLSDKNSIKKCITELNKIDKKIDILINNAGALFDEEETTVKTEKLRNTLEVNLIGTIDFSEQILDYINNSGHIINISSTAGSLKLTSEKHSHFEGHYPAYKISKTALNMYTLTLAKRLAPDITVSAVHPGWVKTDMGGNDADLTPAESAEDIYNFAISKPETGGFWFKGERLPW